MICVLLALVGLIMKVAAGDPHPRISPAWIFVFLVSRWIMIRGDARAKLAPAIPSNNDDDVLKRADGEQPLSRDEIVSRLREMIADPSTPEGRRQWAQSRLGEFDRQKSPNASNSLVSMPRIRRSILSGTKWRRVWQVLVLMLALDFGLMASGYRLLVNEKVVQSEESYLAGDWGDVGTYDRTVIVCWYWTGRNLKPEAFWYGTARTERDECSLFHDHKSGE